MLKAVQHELKELADPEVARGALRFFKTGPGEYGEGDRFRGIRAADIRRLGKKYRDISIDDAERLLHSPWHEDRALALLLLVRMFGRGDEITKKRIYDLYLANTGFINGWDLVDLSAEHIVGAWLAERSRRPLTRLARSRSLWERRIAILATFHFIRRLEFDETFRIAAMLLDDNEDLIHKAAGWMLREVGNRDRAAEEEFLKLHYRTMPRTMLRYAIEKFAEPRRKAYLKGTVR